MANSADYGTNEDLLVSVQNKSYAQPSLLKLSLTEIYGDKKSRSFMREVVFCFLLKFK
ncbi:MAG: hypothetical protein JJP05_03100 [cyanobacterium endosymbiont of Rhopalodia gibba]|jgi:hypothetical protein